MILPPDSDAVAATELELIDKHTMPSKAKWQGFLLLNASVPRLVVPHLKNPVGVAGTPILCQVNQQFTCLSQAGSVHSQ